VAETFVSIENLANTEYREAQFFFTSRLAGSRRRRRTSLHRKSRTVMGGLAVRFWASIPVADPKLDRNRPTSTPGPEPAPAQRAHGVGPASSRLVSR
jgi:hypothetical protein